MLKQLDDLGIAENTIVVYGTDNGAETVTWPDGGTTPFHGEKGTTWEGGFRVPMLVRWPGVIKPGTIVNDIFSQEDWLPTLLAAAGEPDIVEKLKQGYQANGKTWKVHLDGYNFLPFFKGEVKKGPREEIFYFGQGGDLNAVRWNDWKVSFAVENGNIATAIRDVARLAGDHQPAGRPLREGPRESGMYIRWYGRQHLALRAGAAKAQGVPHDFAGISVPAGQQPERGGHQLQLPPGDAGHETLEGTGNDFVSAELTRVDPEIRFTSRRQTMRKRSISSALAVFGLLSTVSAFAATLNGQVLGAGAPIANSTVTLWAASADAPKQLAEAQTGADGRFALTVPDTRSADASLYLVAKGGQPAANKASGDNHAIALMAVVGIKPPARVVINEFTTVASVWTHAQFLDGSAISGHALGLQDRRGQRAQLR